MDLSRSRFSEWLAQPLLDTDLKEELLEMADSPQKIEDAFGCELQFGTGGLRGILGAGTNRMNIAAQATADVLTAAGLPRRAAIGYDSRIGSERFARETACVLAANGIETYLYPRLEPVPALSFAVRTLSCGVGICITASHNPAQYNGFKVYGPDGCQLTPDRAAQIAKNLRSHSYFDGHKTESFASLLAAGRIRWIPDAVLDAFVDAVLALRMGSGSLSDLSVVYTPLHGSGLECVEKLLGRLGVGRLTLVEAQKDPDGHFPTCPYPNPEIPEAMALGLACCARVHPDLLIGTDPDCDRCGVAVPDKTGGYRLLTGNEIGVLLLDYLCRRRLQNGTMPENPVAVTTIVSTDMVTAVANKYGVELRRVLTGFKYIGEQIALLEAGGHPERYIFGFEESYGYLSGPHVRDKDAVNAVLLICEAAAWYAQQGKTLLDAIEALYREFGYYRNALCSFAFEGESGMHTMQELMKKLRANAPEDIAGYKVESVVDYDTDGTGLPRANVLEYHLDGGHKLMVRPSGTEPKIKVYLSAVGDSEAAADAVNAALAKAAADMMKA